MNRYSIYCTPEQTKRVYKLGASIELYSICVQREKYTIVTNDFYVDFKVAIPTAEQMRGWLREKNIFISVCHNCAGYGVWLKNIVPSEHIGELIGYFDTEPQALLVAIDAALDYLEKGE